MVPSKPNYLAEAGQLCNWEVERRRQKFKAEDERLKTGLVHNSLTFRTAEGIA
jgi:hypothetical protein